MKKFLWVFSVLILLVLTGCEGDDGSDGIDGQDAVTSGTISGSVLDTAGNPVAGAQIETNPPTITTSTNASGTFSLPDIPLGTYTVMASEPAMGSCSLVCGVAGGGVTSINLTFSGQNGSAPVTISGTVQDTAGQAILGATVAVEGQNISTSTAVDGYFILENVAPGFIYLNVQSPSTDFLDGGNREAIFAAGDAPVEDILITLSGRPSENATYVGINTCKSCHQSFWPEIFEAYDGSPDAAVHSRFVTEGTSHLVYKDMWPEPGGKLLPLDKNNNLLLAQDPLDGSGLVHVVLCTEDGATGRDYLFKFYPEQPEGVVLGEEALDCSDTAGAVWVPVAATIGGEGNWGEGYVDPEHTLPDHHPNFGEGKQRYMARIQDVPYVSNWLESHGINRDTQKQDYICYLPAFVMQDGTAAALPDGSPNPVLAEGEVGTPTFWEKSPSAWCNPYNTLSRNCAGCHATGLSIETQDFPETVEFPHDHYKEVVTDWNYTDLNITCERCHGPGSEHISAPMGTMSTKLIMPQYLAVEAANETCGQCHANHDGKSEVPEGVYKPAYDARNKDNLGNGFFVPGLYSLETFFFKFNIPMAVEPGTLSYPWKTGSFLSWPDQTHARVHSQEYLEMRRSIHYNNSYQKLACFDCHNAHSLDGGPSSLVANGYDFESVAYGNNALCLACHATHGPFENINTEDVAVLQLDAGRTVTKDGTNVVVDAYDAALSRDRIARAVAEHMQVGAGMGGALYTPEDPDMPVGNCASCHMAKIGKLQNIDVEAFWHLDFDQDGNSAVAEGNIPSHVFDIVWPAQSAVLKATATNDYDIMPNSCSKCHDFARLSGDLD